jgi:hypothetical protein
MSRPLIPLFSSSAKVDSLSGPLPTPRELYEARCLEEGLPAYALLDVLAPEDTILLAELQLDEIQSLLDLFATRYEELLQNRMICLKVHSINDLLPLQQYPILCLRLPLT